MTSINNRAVHTRRCFTKSKFRSSVYISVVNLHVNGKAFFEFHKLRFQLTTWNMSRLIGATDDQIINLSARRTLN